MLNKFNLKKLIIKINFVYLYSRGSEMGIMYVS